jgi:hypothetical protein
MVEILGYVMPIVFMSSIVALPISCAIRGYGFFRLHLTSLPLMLLLLLLFSAWSHYYVDLQLHVMGFDFHGMSAEERIRNVAPELRDKADSLYWPKMGIGWPLKAMIAMTYFAPFPTVVWISGLLLKLSRRKQKANSSEHTPPTARPASGE